MTGGLKWKDMTPAQKIAWSAVGAIELFVLMALAFIVGTVAGL